MTYELESRSGTRKQFADMVQRCRATGVDIYVDVVLNHMTAGDGVGSAGTTYVKYEYNARYGPEDFHAHPNPDDPDVLCDRSTANYRIPTEVQTCELLGLADLRTEDDDVQDRIATYMADLYGLGVRGYRIDAAKHVPRADLVQILERLHAKLPAGATFFVDQEVVDLGDDAVPKTEYFATGSVDEFTYSLAINDAFFNRDDATVETLERPEDMPFLAPSDKAVPFVDNHDTQRGRMEGLYLTYKRSAIYALATVFMLAYPYGSRA